MASFLQIMNTDEKNFISDFLLSIYPLSYFPQGGNDLYLPPWGKVRKGVWNKNYNQ
jgi:hypothetical protein